MAEEIGAVASSARRSLGRVTVPVRFGEQIITSLLYNHDANPVHHRADHAVQWLLGLFSSNPPGESAEGVGAEERLYTLATGLLERPERVVMPGVVLAALCFEQFVRPDEPVAQITSNFTYPLLVPLKGEVQMTVEGYEVSAQTELGGRRLEIEAYSAGPAGAPARLLKMEALVFAPEADREAVFQRHVAPQFAELGALTAKLPDLPRLHHPAAISKDDRRRYLRMVGKEHGITPSAWQAKITRVLTEIIDVLLASPPYVAEVTKYYAERQEEKERRAAIARYVGKEVKYRRVAESGREARVEQLSRLALHVYARQHTAFDVRLFGVDGPATAPASPFILDLSLHDMRLRRGVHRFYTGARLNGRPVFMGEAMVMRSPLVTRELAEFLCEVNCSFDTLRLFEYGPCGAPAV